MEISKIKKIIRCLLGFKISFEENDYFRLIDGKNPDNFLEFKVSLNILKINKQIRI
jgi:hypothetical protein